MIKCVMNHVVVMVATANRRSKMKNIIKLILSAIFIFGSVPTLNASDMKMDNVNRKKKKNLISNLYFWFCSNIKRFRYEDG